MLFPLGLLPFRIRAVSAERVEREAGEVGLAASGAANQLRTSPFCHSLEGA